MVLAPVLRLVPVLALIAAAPVLAADAGDSVDSVWICQVTSSQATFFFTPADLQSVLKRGRWGLGKQFLPCLLVPYPYGQEGGHPVFGLHLGQFCFLGKQAEGGVVVLEFFSFLLLSSYEAKSVKCDVSPLQEILFHPLQDFFHRPRSSARRCFLRNLHRVQHLVGHVRRDEAAEDGNLLLFLLVAQLDDLRVVLPGLAPLHERLVRAVALQLLGAVHHRARGRPVRVRGGVVMRGGGGTCG